MLSTSTYPGKRVVEDSKVSNKQKFDKFRIRELYKRAQRVFAYLDLWVLI